jgi:hypothetical protein
MKPEVFTRGQTAYLTGRWLVDPCGDLMLEVRFPVWIFFYASDFIYEYEIYEIQGERC